MRAASEQPWWMGNPMIAYHGREDLKTRFVAEILKHEQAHAIVKGTYGERVGDRFRGCAIGCSVESIALVEGVKDVSHGDHRLYEQYLGVPIVLAHLEDRIFEGLAAAEARTWPRRFASAIRPGADLSMVGPRFLLDLLTAPEGAVQRGGQTRPQVAAAIGAVIGLFRGWMESGTKPSATQWREARNLAAASAYDASAYAAYAAASASAASASAADYPDYPASAADASAYAADASASAYAAYAAAYAADASAYAARATVASEQEFSRQAASLLRLLETA
jgi:hypothetical protein